MALASTCSWEVRTTGNDGQGGAYAGDSSLAIPAAPTLALVAGGTMPVGNWWVVIAYTGAQGEGPMSPQTLIATSAGNLTVKVTSPPASSTGLYGGATGWRAYFTPASGASGGPYWFQGGATVAIGTDYTQSATPASGTSQPMGTDRSQQNSAQVNIDNATITTSCATNIMTFTAGYTPTAADVGNVIQMTGGTNITTGFYQIQSFTPTSWTLTGPATLP